jgi:hypothetical protein
MTHLLEQINHQRRRFFGVAAMVVGTAHLAMTGSAKAQAAGAKPAADAPKGASNASFGPLKQIDAGVLNVGYAEAGPAEGPPVILLHGWPYDIYAFVDVAPVLASAGYRVIIPYLRGYGTTRFLSSDTPRNGQQAVVAADIIALMDAPPSGAVRGTTNTATTFRSRSGRSLRRSGISMTRPSIAAPRPSKIRTMSASWSIIIAGGLA